MTTKLKIAICVNHYYPSIGGAEIVSQTIVDYLSEYHDIFIFTRRLNKKRTLSEFKCPIIEYHPANYAAFETKIKSLNLDFIFVYSDVFDFFRQLITLYKGNEQLVICPCGANWLYSHRNYINLLYRKIPKIKAIICHSKQDRDFQLFSADKFEKKLSIIPNGVWKNEFDKNTLTKEELLPKLSNKQWLLNVSNFFPGKGQEHLIEILELLPNSENIAYIQISNDIDFSIGLQLESMWKAKRSKLKEKNISIKLLKNLEREKVVGFFKQSNVFVFSSEKEVAPLVLLEAMAANLPWISTNIGNAKELSGGIVIPAMKDSRFHSVFNSTVKKQFVSGIQDLLNTPQIADSGRQQIEKKLEWTQILPQYRYLLEEPHAKT